MVPIDKVRVLSELSSYDMEQEESVRHIPLGQKGDSLPLYNAKTPNGKCTLFKTLMANRVSINLETASPSHLSEIASNKDFKNDILKRQAWVRSLQRNGKCDSAAPHNICPRPGGEAKSRFRAVSHTSQIMVGVNGETDREIFSLVESEYDHMNLSRIYYPAFKPLINTPLEHHPAAPRWRQNRLYQLDWPYRVYGYSREEVHLAFSGDFLTDLDPKTAIARTVYERPLEINGAEEGDLLRVPGIGPKTSKSLSKCREKITSLMDLRKHGVILSRALPFLKINGLHQTTISSFN